MKLPTTSIREMYRQKRFAVETISVSANEMQADLERRIAEAGGIPPWHIAVLVEKINDKARLSGLALIAPAEPGEFVVAYYENADCGYARSPAAYATAKMLHECLGLGHSVDDVLSIPYSKIFIDGIGTDKISYKPIH